MQQKKTHAGNGALAELDFWRERTTFLCTLHAELKAPGVQPFLELFSQVDSSLELVRKDVNHLYAEAKDNNRFLTTLERHFKNLTYGTNFQASHLKLGVVLFTFQGAENEYQC